MPGNLKFLVTALLAVLCGLLGHGTVLSQQPVSGTQKPASAPRGAEIKWLHRGTPPGKPIRLRIRGQVLDHLLLDGHWAIEGPNGALPATLVLPPDPARPVVSDLNNYTLRDSGDDLVIDFDREADLFAINRLEIRLAHSDVLCTAHVKSSSDNDAFTWASAGQLIYQQISGGQVTRVCTLKLEETSDRYIRVTLKGMAAAPLDVARCWFEPEYGHPGYRVNASINTMREGAVPGESVWPLNIQNETRPLLKLKVLASTTGEIRPVRLTRPADTEDGLPIEYSVDWIDGISHGGLTLSNKWIVLPQLDYGNDWSLVVDDPGGSILPLSRVEVYAAEVFLELAMPEYVRVDETDGGGPKLVLWQTEEFPPEVVEPVLSDGDPVVAGEFIGWSLNRPEVELVQPRPAFDGKWNEQWWFKPSVYAAGAVVLLLLGLVLLGRPKSAP